MNHHPYTTRAQAQHDRDMIHELIFGLTPEEWEAKIRETREYLRDDVDEQGDEPEDEE